MKSPSSRQADILAAVGRREMYGRQIQAVLQEASGEPFPAGTLYTTLSRMVDLGWAESRRGTHGLSGGGAHRKYFKITDRGRVALRVHKLLTTAPPIAGGAD